MKVFSYTFLRDGDITAKIATMMAAMEAMQGQLQSLMAEAVRQTPEAARSDPGISVPVGVTPADWHRYLELQVWATTRRPQTEAAPGPSELIDNRFASLPGSHMYADMNVLVLARGASSFRTCQ